MILRSACSCGSTEGDVSTKNGQDVVRCVHCHAYQYCAPRTETGRNVRPVSTRPNLKPSVRYRILEQFGFTCLSCGQGAPDVELTIDHIISRAAAERAGVLDDLIDSDDNLAPMCAECNSGKQAAFTVQTIKLIHRALRMRQRVGNDAA